MRRLFALLSVVACLSLAIPAVAQDAPPPPDVAAVEDAPVSVLTPALTQRLLDAGAELAIVLLLMGASFVTLKLKLSDDRRKLLGGGIEIAYGVVAELARKSPNKLDDKGALALKELAAFFSASGAKPPTEAEQAIALQAFAAKHAAEKLAAPSPT